MCLSGIAQVRTEYNGIEAIKEIHEGWLIVRLPGFEKKIAALDSLLNLGSLPERSRINLEREKLQTITQRDFIQKWYPVVFDSAYTFSRVGFINTEETAGFQNGEIQARSGAGEPIESIYHENYFFVTLNGIQSDPFRFTSKDHRLLSFPFPNNIGMPGFLIPGLFSASVPEWIESQEQDQKAVYRVYSHVFRVNRKLNAFYVKWYEEHRGKD